MLLNRRRPDRGPARLRRPFDRDAFAIGRAAWRATPSNKEHRKIVGCYASLADEPVRSEEGSDFDASLDALPRAQEKALVVFGRYRGHRAKTQRIARRNERWLSGWCMAFLLSVGVPSRFTEWCDRVITSLAERRLGEVALVRSDAPDALASALIRIGASHFVVSSRQPGYWLRRLLDETGKSLVLVLDDPRPTVANLMATLQIDCAQATRITASSFASVTQCLPFPGALVLLASRDAAQPAATAAAIARHLGLEASEPEVEEIVASLAQKGLTAQADPEWLRNVSEQQMASIDGALSAYIEKFKGQSLRDIIWHRDLFFTDDGKPADGAIDITGRRRFLIYGPFITLPPGQWIAEVLLAFSQEATELDFVVDANAGSQLAFVNIRPRKDGILPVIFSFEIGEANDSPLEIRVLNERPAFDGKLALVQVRLDAQQQIPSMSDWVRELGFAPKADG